MTIQTNSNILVALRRETSIGVTATATGATQFRLIGSPGLELKRAPIVAQELRADGNTSMGRLGGKSVGGSYSSELTAGGHTTVLSEAIMRSAYVTSTAIGFATMTTIAIGTNTLTAAGGDFVGGQGIRVGDIFRLSGTTVSGDNNTNNIVVAVGSMTIVTTTGAFTTLAATATGTLTILRKVINGASPTRLSHTLEQYDTDIDLSELFLGCRVDTMKLSCKPNAMAMLDFSFVGVDRTALATGTSPYFTSPALSTGLGMIADDSSILYNGAVVATFTGFDLMFTIGTQLQPVLGSFVSPDVYDNILNVTGTISALRQDFSNLTLFDAETEFSVQILLQELASAPKPCLSVFLPRVKLSGLTTPVGGGNGPKIQTLTLMAAPKVAATGYDGTIASISSSTI